VIGYPDDGEVTEPDLEGPFNWLAEGGLAQVTLCYTPGTPSLVF
jgi:hypothetical protein